MEQLRPILITFPRSGLHYFVRLFYKEIGLNIENGHEVNWIFGENNKKERTVITIARDPKDSIASYIAYEQSRFAGFNWTVSDTRINQIVTEYILMCNFLYDHADYVIDFNDLVKSPDTTIKKIINLLNIEKENYHLFPKFVKKEDKLFKESSKDLPYYDRNMLDRFNVDGCYPYYNRLLEKRIKV
jgi:hypothetical protein